MKDIWEKKHQDSKSSEFEEIQVNSDSVAEPDIEKYSEANPELDKKEFARLMCDGKREKFSFCSNITSWQLVKEGAFDYVTTNSNNIIRIKSEKAKEKKGGEKREESIDVCSNDDRESTDKRKKKEKKQNIILVGISVIFCLVLVLMLKMETY